MKFYQTLCGVLFFILIAVTGVSATSTVVPAQIPGYVLIYSDNNVLYLINLKSNEIKPINLGTTTTSNSDEEVLLPTNTAITGTAGLATPGEIVNFSATVTPVQPNPQIPTGNVVFMAQQGEYNTITLGIVPLDSEGQANILSSFADPAPYLVQAYYEGDLTYQYSLSGAWTLDVVN